MPFQPLASMWRPFNIRTSSSKCGTSVSQCSAHLQLLLAACSTCGRDCVLADAMSPFVSMCRHVSPCGAKARKGRVIQRHSAFMVASMSCAWFMEGCDRYPGVLPTPFVLNERLIQSAMRCLSVCVCHLRLLSTLFSALFVPLLPIRAERCRPAVG